jgi:hypothetical protein
MIEKRNTSKRIVSKTNNKGLKVASALLFIYSEHNHPLFSIRSIHRRNKKSPTVDIF